MPFINGTLLPTSSDRRNSAPPTRSDAPPPKPFNSATICGIAVIFTVRAIQMPSAVPTTMPAMMISYETICRSNRVMTIAISIPIPDRRFPCRAVAGLFSFLRPMMKRTAASR